MLKLLGCGILLLFSLATVFNAFSTHDLFSLAIWFISFFIGVIFYLFNRSATKEQTTNQEPKTRWKLFGGTLLFVLISPFTVIGLVIAFEKPELIQPQKKHDVPNMSSQQKDQAKAWLFEFADMINKEKDDTFFKDAKKRELHLQQLEELDNRAVKLFGRDIDTNKFAVCEYSVGSALNYWREVNWIMTYPNRDKGSGLKTLINWSSTSGQHFATCFNLFTENKIIELQNTHM